MIPSRSSWAHHILGLSLSSSMGLAAQSCPVAGPEPRSTALSQPTALGTHNRRSALGLDCNINRTRFPNMRSRERGTDRARMPVMGGVPKQAVRVEVSGIPPGTRLWVGLARR